MLSCEFELIVLMVCLPVKSVAFLTCTCVRVLWCAQLHRNERDIRDEDDAMFRLSERRKAHLKHMQSITQHLTHLPTLEQYRQHHSATAPHSGGDAEADGGVLSEEQVAYSASPRDEAARQAAKEVHVYTPEENALHHTTHEDACGCTH